MRITTKSCIQHANNLRIPVYGDSTLRDPCKKEDPELASFHQWVKYNYPQLEHMCFHVPNEWTATTKSGGQYQHAARMKNMGVKPRLADWICLGANGNPPFLCEMKRRNIQLSLSSRERKIHFIEQCDLLHKQMLSGAVVCVALGADAAKAAFIEYMEKWK